MENPVEDKARRRVVLIGRLFLLWALAIAGRLVYLQVYKHDELLAAAKGQQQHDLKVAATRGEILDRRGAPLAISVRTESVVVNPQVVKDAGFFGTMVGPVVGIEPAELTRQVLEHQGRARGRKAGRGFLMVKRHITAEEKYRLSPLLRMFPFEIVPDQRREYPGGALAAHVVGSLDADGRGNAGVEQKLNSELTGKPRRVMMLTGSQRDSYGSWVADKEDEGEEGANLTLSIDPVIQHDAEQFLSEGVKESGAASGTAIALDPQTGEVFALANYPSFDPRRVKPTKEEAVARHGNIAAQIPCEPGSVMKMITVTMGIDTGKFTEDTPVFCENGSFPRPNRRPIHDLHRMGTMSVAGILIKSSNIGVAKISIAAGPKTLADYLQRFGIGLKSGIELPAESRGLLRKQECAGPRDTNCWSSSSHEYIAFGHEVAATAVQLARAVSVIANGGLLVQPHLVIRKARPTADGRLESLPLDLQQPRRVLKPETAFTVRRIMQGVVLEGTGKRAAIPGYSAGGKTGSAEIFENGVKNTHLHNSSFIGFAPVVNPRVVVVVTLNRTPKQGGIAAAPVFSKLAQTALRVLQVPKDMPETDVTPKTAAPAANDDLPETRIAKIEADRHKAEAEAKAKAESKETKAAATGPQLLAGPTVPDFKGKNVVAVLRESASLGMPVEISGRGRARSQQPAAGSVLPEGGRIHVEFTSAP